LQTNEADEWLPLKKEKEEFEGLLEKNGRHKRNSGGVNLFRRTVLETIRERRHVLSSSPDGASAKIEEEGRQRSTCGSKW